MVDIEKLMVEAKEVQNKLNLAQARLLSAHVVGMSNNGEVKISMNGKYIVTNTEIIDNIDKQRLQACVTDAINNAINKLISIATPE